MSSRSDKYDEKTKKRKYDSSSESDVSSDDSDSKKRKHSHDNKEKKHKKHKKEKKHKKDKKNKKEKKGKALHESEKISASDYYNKAAEFREWLLERKGRYLADLDTNTAKQHFSSFVELWNNKELPSKYYKGIAVELQEAGTRTKYQWGFAKKLDPVEMYDWIPDYYLYIRGNLRESIWEETNKGPKPRSAISSPKVEDPDLGPVVGPPKPQEEQLDPEEKEALELYLKKKDRKNYKKDKETVEEELVPKNTGREATIEKKKMKAQYTKPKESEDVELDDKSIYGETDIHSKLERRKEWQERKILAKLEAREKAMQEYSKKEEEKLAPFKALLQAGQIPLLQNRPQQ